MNKHRRMATGLLLGMACLVGLAASAGAQESFAGKTVKLVVAYSPGGSFDLYTRLIARHIGKHLPGKPSTIVQNMTGAAGMIAANYVYNTAKPDGLTIGAFAGPLVLQHVMGNRSRRPQMPPTTASQLQPGCGARAWTTSEKFSGSRKFSSCWKGERL